MARLIYPRGFDIINSVWTSAVIRILLERSTSTYVPDIDHDHLDSFTGGGGVEITVATYGRQTIGTPAKAWDAAKDQLEYDCADVAFGSLESGQTVKAAIVYRRVGADDSTPADDDLLLYDDGKINVTAAATAAAAATLLWVQPLEANLPSGTTLVFGAVTATTTSAASRGGRSLAVSSLSGEIAAGVVAADVVTDSILPAVLQNGPFSYQINADGLIVLTQRGLFAV